MTFRLYKDRAGEWRWNLKSTNGNIIADSGEGYINKADAVNGINLVKVTSASTDVIED